MIRVTFLALAFCLLQTVGLGQCKYVNGVILDSGKVIQCSPKNFIIMLTDGSRGETQKGSQIVSHEGDRTKLELCYYTGDGYYITMPWPFRDTVDIPFPESGNREVEVIIRNSPGVKDSTCKTCTEVFSKTFSITVYPRPALVIHPNPALRQIAISNNDNSPLDEIELFLYDLNGRLVREISTPPNGHLVTINTDALAPGIYILKTEDVGECDALTKKIVIVN